MDFASLAAQIEGAMSEDDDSDEEMMNNAESGEAGKEEQQGAASGAGSGEAGDEGEEEGSEDEASKAEDLLASLIAASTKDIAPETSSAPAAGPDASIDPILESLAASLASTPVVSRAGSPSASQPPRPAGPSRLRNDASTSSEAAAPGSSQAGPTPTMFATRTYSTELPRFTDSAAELSAKAAGKQPDRAPAPPQTAPRPAATAAPKAPTAGPSAHGPVQQSRQAAKPAVPRITNPSTPTGVVNATSLNDLQTMPNGEPPNYPWSTIIRAAILGSPYGILSKQEIVKVVLSKWPPFHRRGSQLDAAITYNLRAKLCFLRVRVAGEGKTSFYIVDLTTDASKARPTPYRPRSAAQRKALPPFTASRYSIAFAYSRNNRTGKVPAFLPPQKSATTATQAAIDQALQAALSELTGRQPPSSAPETPEKVVQPQCQIKGSQVVTRMRYANGANSDEDPDPSEDDSEDEESEEEEDDEQPEDMEAIRAAEGGRGGPRLGSSLTALIGGSSSAPLPTRRGLGSSLANIGGASAASSRWAHRNAGSSASGKTAAPAGAKGTSLDARIAAALASVGAQLNEDSDDDDDDDEVPGVGANGAASAPPTVAAFGLDFAAMNKEIEAALASSSDSDDDDEDEDVEMGDAPLDFDQLLAQATGQSQASPAPAVDKAATTSTETGPSNAPTSNASSGDPVHALLSILQVPSTTTGTKRTADEANLDGDIATSLPTPLPAGVVRLIKEVLKKAPTEPGQTAGDGQEATAGATSPDAAALNAVLVQALAAQKQTAAATTASAPAKSTSSKAATESAAPARKVGAPPIISTYNPKRSGAQSAAAQKAATAKQASASQPAGAGSPSPGGTDAGPQTVTAPNGEVFEKPKATYPELAKEAINSVPDKRLTASDIFQIVEAKHPYFVHASESWKATLRNVLTSHSCFVKVPRPAEAPGRGDYWATIDVPTWKRRRTTAKAKREEQDHPEGTASSFQNVNHASPDDSSSRNQTRSPSASNPGSRRSSISASAAKEAESIAVPPAAS